MKKDNVILTTYKNGLYVNVYRVPALILKKRDKQTNIRTSKRASYLLVWARKWILISASTG